LRQVFLNAGFGEPLPELDRSWIRGREFHGVRSDYGPRVLEALYFTPFQPLIIASDRERSHEYVSDRVAAVCREARSLGYLHHRPYPTPVIEPMNEPDLDPYWASRPAALADLVWECWQTASKRRFSGIRIVAPGISNLNERGLNYLERMMAAGIPDDVAIGFHRYPPGNDATEPHDGFKDRWAEVAELRRLAGKRKLWLTETGWTAGPRKHYGFPNCLWGKNRWLSEQEVADRVVTELRFWARVPNLEAAVVYQINDGPNRNDPEDNYGLLTYPERRDKILAKMMPKLIEEVTNEKA